ncbi:Uma2 family endonuclease [Deferribacter thermophilus]|uniref:Uma2 family endonuclease n=1 Tax=Deferribacter thermophilus TaxID=53573 RepID=UPI003C1B1D07
MCPLAKKADKKYTYQDYLTWPDEERWEIIDGNAYNMSPSPSTKHQLISRNITGELYKNKSKLKSCEFFEAPTDVVLDDFNVVLPDIFIVCDKDKITDKNIQGAPDLVIEIVSKSTAYKDTKIKKDLYEAFGVKEYILVFPELEIVERYVLSEGKYGVPERFNWDETLKLKTFDIEIPLWEVFEKEIKEEQENK